MTNATAPETATPNTCHRRDDRTGLLEYAGPARTVDFQLADGTSVAIEMCGIYDLSNFSGRALEAAKATPDLFGSLVRWVPVEVIR